MIKRFFDYLLNEKLDIQERLFGLSTAIGLTGVAAAFVSGLILGESKAGLIYTAASFFCYLVIVYLGYRFRRVGLAAWLISVSIIFIFLPLTFFTSGGIYGGSPIWFLFGIIYVGMIMKGGSRVFFLLSGVVVTAVCWGVGKQHPEYIVQHTEATAYSDAMWSLYIVCGVLLSLIIFQTYLYRRENQRAAAQKKEIEELGEAQNRFFSSISHEIRTPINTIIGLNEMILRENASKEINEDAVNIQTAGRMLLHLINDILDMSKIRSGQMQLTTMAYNTGDMITDIVGMISVKAKEKNLKFSADVTPKLPAELIGDEVRIKQILINILNNAIKYTNEGSVSMSVQCASLTDNRMNVIFAVTDTGMGIKKESMPFLFNAYQRADEEKNRYIEGTGLGLSIVKQLLDLMDGRITVNSVYTKGSTFIVEIPQMVADSKPVGELDFAGSTVSRSRDYKYNRSFEAPEAKILVCDDTAANLIVVEKLLRPIHADVTTVKSGAMALEKTLDNHYHVILMDHMMPEMDGIECMHRIRNQTGGQCKDSKIVIFTANAGSEHRARYTKEGFDGYLVKPVTGNALEAELRKQLPREIVLFAGDAEKIFSDGNVVASIHSNKTLVSITTETVADLPGDYKEKNKVSEIPYKVITDRGIFRDGMEIETRGAISYMQSTDANVYSQPPGVEEYEAFFARQLENSYNVIHIALSSNIMKSGCEDAMEASRAFDNVTVIDSQQVGGGHGLLVIMACRLAGQGLSPREITEELLRIRSRVVGGFIVDDAEYLVRARQIPARISGFTRAFMIHPVIVMKKGRMKLGRVCFGTREKAWETHVRKALKSRRRLDKRLLIITHVGLTHREIESIREAVLSVVKFENIYVNQASPAIAVNCGPGTFGLYCFTQDDVDIYKP